MCAIACTLLLKSTVGDKCSMEQKPSEIEEREIESTSTRESVETSTKERDNSSTEIEESVQSTRYRGNESDNDDPLYVEPVSINFKDFHADINDVSFQAI